MTVSFLYEGLIENSFLSAVIIFSGTVMFMTADVSPSPNENVISFLPSWRSSFSLAGSMVITPFIRTIPVSL